MEFHFLCPEDFMLGIGTAVVRQPVCVLKNVGLQLSSNDTLSVEIHTSKKMLQYLRAAVSEHEGKLIIFEELIKQ